MDTLDSVERSVETHVSRRSFRRVSSSESSGSAASFLSFLGSLVGAVTVVVAFSVDFGAMVAVRLMR